MGLPEILMIIFLTTIVCYSISKHGEMEKTSVWESIIGVGILVLLLWWGGFWK